jgi:hypothetical protein
MNRPLRIVLATGANDAFVERIESSLMRVAKSGGHEVLLLVEGRDPVSGDSPVIDLEELADASLLSRDVYASYLAALGPVVDDTRWYATLRSYPIDHAAIEDKLVAAASTIDGILNAFRPDVVLTWNGLLGIRAVAANRARRAGIPVLYCERGALAGSWCADASGVNAASSIALDPMPSGLRAALSTPLSEAERESISAELAAVARAGVSAWEQAGLRDLAEWRGKLGISANCPVLFFPLQVDADTNMRFFSPHFGGSLQALEAVAEAVRKVPGWYLLVKPHPKGNYPPGRIEQIVGDRGRCVADINIHDALALASLVVTINSTVATEAAWANKPVLQLGRGILTNKRIVAEFDPGSPLDQQLPMAIDAWRGEPTRFDRALRFYEYLARTHLLQAGDDSHSARLIERLQHTINDPTGVARVPSARDIAQAHVWLPAQRLLARLADLKPMPVEIVLIGYGRNARRLMLAASRTPLYGRCRWFAWDDAPVARNRAATDGLSVFNGELSPGRTTTLFVVTPRNPSKLAGRLDACGCRAGVDYWTLFSDDSRSHFEAGTEHVPIQTTI